MSWRKRNRHCCTRATHPRKIALLCEPFSEDVPLQDLEPRASRQGTETFDCPSHAEPALLRSNLPPNCLCYTELGEGAYRSRWDDTQAVQ